jgi:hypothetical protein
LIHPDESKVKANKLKDDPEQQKLNTDTSWFTARIESVTRHGIASFFVLLDTGCSNSKKQKHACQLTMYNQKESLFDWQTGLGRFVLSGIDMHK